jgi:GT2 family glycosyltransferase
MKVATIVVTRNRKQLLLECLSGILNQTRPVDRIYIVDNASSDGTGQRLREAGFLRNPVVEYLQLEKNVGGAGGFSVGLERAYRDGYDWFWLMDDDVEPFPDGLAELLKFRRVSGCIHGRRKNPDGTPTPWGVIFYERTVTTKEIPDSQFEADLDTRKVNIGCFEGMLISRDVVSQIGFPDPAFFIAWDDTFYGYLASRVTRVLYINSFVLKRKLSVRKTTLPLVKTCSLMTPFSLFYYHRNRWLIAKKLHVCRLPFWIATASVTLRALFRELVLVHSVSRATIILKGLISGLRLRVNTTELVGNGFRETTQGGLRDLYLSQEREREFRLTGA